MILQRLRAETRAQHEALEGLLPFGRPELALPIYATALARFWGFYATWEQEAALHAAPLLGAVLRERRKLPLLEADLRFLQINHFDLPRLDPGALPPFHEAEGTLLGSMYVIEGSTLGGQLISRELERSSGFHSGLGYSFFRSYGKAVGQQWKVFTALLEAASRDEEAAIIEGASATFSAFAKWFEPLRGGLPPAPNAEPAQVPSGL